MSYEWFVAKRYIWSKRRHPFVGVVSFVSIAGISLGTASLIVVMAVMNGFDNDLKNRIIGTRAHLVIERSDAFTDYSRVTDGLNKEAQVAGAAPFVEGQALVQNGEWGTGVMARGVEPAQEKKASSFFSHIQQGELLPAKDSAVLGNELAKRLRVRVGDTVSILSQAIDKPEKLKVTGIFSTGMYEYDANLLYLNLGEAQKIFGLGTAVSGVSVALKDAEKADSFKKAAQHTLGYPYYVSTWMDMNKTLFGALKLEKIVMFLILALIILVAALNVAGSLTILVIDKTRDIGVLKAIGAPASGIIKIFTMDGLVVGLAGTLSGLAIGVGLCFVIGHYPLVELPKEIYYLEKLPVKMSLFDTAAVSVTALFLSLACSIYPAWTAGKLDPVKALKS